MGDKITVIGERTKVSGNLEGDEDLTVKGRVEGTIRLTKTLHVESGGIVVADVQVKDCVISGAVVGDVNATDSVHITNGGKMVGDINAPRVIIVAGAAFRGRVDMGDLESERGERPRAAQRPAPRAEVRPAAVAAASSSSTGGNGGRPAVLARPAQPSRPTTPTAVAPRIASSPNKPAPLAPSLPGGKKQFHKKK
jgi:cytoskeletal protein CcmA (bactofilin family)